MYCNCWPRDLEIPGQHFPCLDLIFIFFYRVLLQSTEVQGVFLYVSGYYLFLTTYEYGYIYTRLTCCMELLLIVIEILLPVPHGVNISIRSAACLGLPTTHHLGEVLEGSATVVHNPVECVYWPNTANYNLIFALGQSLINLLRECVQGHSQLATRILAHVVVQFRYSQGSALKYQHYGARVALLWTGGGEISTTLVFECRSCSRRQRVNTFRAAFDAEYAGSVAADTMAKFEPVLIHPLALAADCSRVGVLQDETSWVRVLLKIRQKGMGERDEAGKVDLHFLVERVRSNLSRSVRSYGFCTPALNTMESISGDSFITLFVVHHPVSMWKAAGEDLGKDTVPCDKIWNLGKLSNVEPLALRMCSPESLHEFIQTVLPPTHGGDHSPRLN